MNVLSFILSNELEMLSWEGLTILMMWGSSLSVLFLQVFTPMNAPYGRFNNFVSSWGPQMSFRWGWILQEAPAFVLSSFFFLTGDKTKGFLPFVLGLSSKPDFDYPNVIAILMFMTHYFHRAFIYPLRLPDPKPCPVLIVLMAFVFCTVNGSLQGHMVCNRLDHPLTGSPSSLPPLLLLRLSAGMFYFLLGMWINIEADHQMISLKKAHMDKLKDVDRKTLTVKQRYLIPKGSWFDRLSISCPNYFGECVEWTGFWLFTGSPSALAFAFFSFAFIGTRALQTHRWYHSTFGKSYPQKRTAFWPFLPPLFSSV
uniref:3-oxo-5-alpha-steroid 4-dehydrogenase C-terminal domain-containing protein n=1 Tax=Chromera velia CCMP2878 TaxID=1169474 RepID=A0A0G4GYN5_9ALVE|eukprot:Cvel_5403.t1-p1 / transcript=Cvel_5403.t1 / gene=Cvel_5403 / organism=Chromera_velia_CCMP2878 / gene_product=Steroid 5-alpha-reductase DET2, putative / transcript_product=Steroid 5-alpha-reductase DET2, putative / location=Cvel_scaffold251:86304-88168(+) / protein_length=311 / sequence_SO=supercontig / SO=protein_coding / is_pseudo=false